jgi:myo-inositol-1(or 4)-monophosphatase
LLEHEKNVGSIRFKSNNSDIVTDADLLVEKFLIEELGKLTPEAGFIGEETRTHDSKLAMTWIIDPIDGTRYFAEGLSCYAISIALIINDIPQIGIISLPKDNKIFCAINNLGLYVNGKITLMPSKKISISESICYIDTDKIDEISPTEKKWVGSTITNLLSRVYRVRMFGVSSIAYCWMCLGIVDAFIDITGQNPEWDSVAGSLILKEAGASCTYVKTKEGPQKFLAANPNLLADYVNILNPGEKYVKQ